MKIEINKRFVNNDSFYGTVLKSELIIDLNSKNVKYNREYIPFDIEEPKFENKKEYSIECLLDIPKSKYNHLIDLLNNIKQSDFEPKVFKSNIEYLSYIDLKIDDKDFQINTNSLEYEMLIHLSTFEFFDINEIDYIEKKSMPIPK